MHWKCGYSVQGQDPLIAPEDSSCGDVDCGHEGMHKASMQVWRRRQSWILANRPSTQWRFL